VVIDVDMKIINKEELRLIEDFINRIKKGERLRNPKYVCEKVIELAGDPYNYPCWNCSRWKTKGLMQRCSWVKFAVKMAIEYKGQRTMMPNKDGWLFSPLFEMTGLELLQEMKKEILGV